MNKIALSLITAMGLCMVVGCAAPVDEPDEAEQVGEAQQKVVSNLSCQIVSVALFVDKVRITNNLVYDILPGSMHFTVHHLNGYADFAGHDSTMNLLVGQHKDYDLANDPGALDASSCTASVFYFPDP